jgi:peptidoglycan hydrolase CwlO-like protein
MASCTAKINELQGRALTLKQTISVLNSKISLAQARINQTQAQIDSLEKDIQILSGVIDTVNISMDQLAQIYIARVQESYKRSRSDRLNMIFSANDLADFMEKLKYLNTLKAKDQLILTELERSRLDYGEKKDAKLDKQKEVEQLKSQLVSQKKALDIQQLEKQKLLRETQNNEKKFQELLSKARSELEAIESIIAGKGQETEVGDISAGQIIAKVIPGPSCNSSGSHLHFIVAKDKDIYSPFGYLKSIEHENCSGSSCGSDDGDSFNPTGSWEWPLSARIKMMQGFGVTWAIKNTWVRSIYNFHNGIDILGGSLDIRAVQNGKLYRGSYSGKSGCALKYVRVHHSDGGLDTYYLHVNYF